MIFSAPALRFIVSAGGWFYPTRRLNLQTNRPVEPSGKTVLLLRSVGINCCRQRVVRLNLPASG